MSPPDFQRLAEERLELLGCDLEVGIDLWRDVVASGEDLREILTAVSQAVELLDDEALWRIAAIAAGREGGALRSAWDSLVEQVDDVVTLAGEADEPLHNHGP